jgi:peptidoglycan/LPS O-acetylase OafA/YrhL
MYYLGILYFLWQEGFGTRYWLGDLESISICNVLANVFFVNDFYPYWITSVVPGGWSIGVEMTFYLMIPFLVSKINTLSKSINFTLLTIILSLGLYVILENNVLISSARLWNEYLFFYLPNQLPVFGCGIILYFLIIKKDYELSLNNLLLGILTIIILLIFKNSIHSNLPFAFLFSIFIYLLSRVNIRLFVNKLTIFMGNISYSSYLVHFALLHWMKELQLLNFLNVKTYGFYLVNFFFNFLLVSIITAMISYLTYLFIEKPFIKYGKQLIQKLN